MRVRIEQGRGYAWYNEHYGAEFEVLEVELQCLDRPGHSATFYEVVGTDYLIHPDDVTVVCEADQMPLFDPPRVLEHAFAGDPQHLLEC